MSAAPSLADQAIALGVPVFPCNSQKKPLTENGWKDATRDPAAIRRIFARHAAALIGMPTGPASGVDVVDVDVKDGKRGADWLERNIGRLPETRTHQTRSGGLHLVFRQPEGVEITNSQSRLGRDVDVRGHGGYIITPPSAGYSVVVDAPPAPMPAWLIEACRKKEPPPLTPRRMAPLDPSDAAARRLMALLEFVVDAREGQRNSRLFWAGCRAAEAAIAGEMPEGAAFAALEQAGIGVGLSALEVRRTLRSARRTAFGSAAA